MGDRDGDGLSGTQGPVEGILLTDPRESGWQTGSQTTGAVRIGGSQGRLVGFESSPIPAASQTAGSSSSTAGPRGGKSADSVLLLLLSVVLMLQMMGGYFLASFR